MSTMQEVAAALQRVESVLQRRPQAGLSDDPPALAQWRGGTRVATAHPDGHEFVTDLSTDLGGSGDRVSPGWLMRCAFAACATTFIAMKAAAQGIALTSLAVQATSRSDARSLFGMRDGDGAVVSAAPRDVELNVRIAAANADDATLRALVEDACRGSPVSSALRCAVPVALSIDIAQE